MQMSEEAERDFNTYLKKYESTYQVKRGNDGVYNILCYPKKPNMDGTFTSICPFSLSGNDKLLLYSLFCPKSARTKQTIKQNLIKKGIWFRITQEGDTEICLCFKEQDLLKVVNIFKIQKRKHYSEKHLEVLRNRMKGLKKTQRSDTNGK